MDSRPLTAKKCPMVALCYHGRDCTAPIYVIRTSTGIQFGVAWRIVHSPYMVTYCLLRPYLRVKISILPMFFIPSLLATVR